MERKIIEFRRPRDRDNIIELTDAVEETIIINEELCRAAKALFDWKYGGARDFTARLYELFESADLISRARLMKSFPDEVMVWTLFKTAESPKFFFDSFNIPFNNSGA